MDKKRILFIDDHELTRRVYSHVLVQAGYDITQAGDGLEGFEKVQAGALYDLIILDAIMPKMDGLSFLAKLEESSFPGKHCPVILLTNLAGDTVVQHALDAGAKACLIKTDLNPDQLVMKVKEYIE